MLTRFSQLLADRRRIDGRGHELHKVGTKSKCDSLLVFTSQPSHLSDTGRGGLLKINQIKSLRENPPSEQFLTQHTVIATSSHLTRKKENVSKLKVGVNLLLLWIRLYTNTCHTAHNKIGENVEQK